MDEKGSLLCECSVCSDPLDPPLIPVATHPILPISVCLTCERKLCSNETEHSSGEVCAFCGEGGQLFCCDSCPLAFCDVCLDKLKILAEVEALETWNCVHCYRSWTESCPRLEALERAHIAALDKNFTFPEGTADSMHYLNCLEYLLSMLFLTKGTAMMKDPVGWMLSFWSRPQ
jgi:hypothetical protein